MTLLNIEIGMISAQCMGPTKVALCQIKLVDLGIYKLTLTPQEFGRHVLQIKYGKEHVPGILIFIHILSVFIIL